MQAPEVLMCSAEQGPYTMILNLIMDEHCAIVVVGEDRTLSLAVYGMLARPDKSDCPSPCYLPVCILGSDVQSAAARR